MTTRKDVRRRTLLTIGVGLLLTALAALGACGSTSQPTSASATASPSTAAVTVRVGYIAADLHHISHIVAKDPTLGGGQSIYQKNGLTVVDAVGAPYANGGVVMDRIAADDVDMALLGLPPAIIKTLNAGVNASVVAQVNAIGSSLVVAKNINRFSDLVGKTVAVPSHSSIQFFLFLTLAQKEGVDRSKITIVDMPVTGMEAALKKGDIAGFIAWEPFPSQATFDRAGKVIATSQEIWPNHPDCVVVANGTFARQHPDAVKRFVQAHVEATQLVNRAKAEPGSAQYQTLVNLGTTFTGRSADVVKVALNQIDYTTATDTAFMDNVGVFTDKLVAYKIIPKVRLDAHGWKDGAAFAAVFVRPTS